MVGGEYQDNVIYSLHNEIGRTGNKNKYWKCMYWFHKQNFCYSSERNVIAEESEIFIEVPRGSIDMYLKRIFDYMSNSDCVEAYLQENRNKKAKCFTLNYLTLWKELN